MSPIRTFIRRPVFTSMLLLAVVVFGLFSYPRIGVDQMPEVDFPIVTVTTILPGADPETVEENVSKPLEEALNTLSGLDTLRSQNFESVSMVVLRFDLAVPVDVAAQDVRDKVQATLSELPKEIETPVVQKLDLGAMPIVQLALSGPVPIEELTRLAEDELKPGLQRLQGVGSIDVVGGREREINVVVRPGAAALLRPRRDRRVAGNQRPEHRRPRRAHARARASSAIVKLETEARSVEELRDLVVASPGGKQIRVRDVANVVDGPGEARSAASLDGRSAVALVIRKQSGANTVEVAERVKADLAALSRQLPEGSKLEVVTDNSKFIRGSISAVQHDLIIGAILAVLVVLVFLRDWRATIVSAVALPTSVIGTFAVMHALGFTFNTVTMLALTLSIGLLIDDAIVVIENIVRHLEKGERPREAALNGHRPDRARGARGDAVGHRGVHPRRVHEGDGRPLLLPVRRHRRGGGGHLLLRLDDAHADDVGAPPRGARPRHDAGRRGARAVLHRHRASATGGSLEWALAHRGLTVAAAVGVLVATVFLGRFLQFTFIPSQDQGGVTVSVELPGGDAARGDPRPRRSGSPRRSGACRAW